MSVMAECASICLLVAGGTHLDSSSGEREKKRREGNISLNHCRDKGSSACIIPAQAIERDACVEMYS